MGTRGLNAQKLASLAIGEYGDGGYLYFIVEAGADDTTNRRWSMRFRTPEGTRTTKKIGNYPDMGLQEARKRAVELGKLMMEGKDIRDIGKPTGPTLKAFIDEHLASWTEGKSAGHAKNWRLAIERMEPLYKSPVTDITISDVVRWAKPIWAESPVVGFGALGFLSQVMGSAVALEVREKANPASWKVIKLTKLLLHPREVKKVEHHAALPYADVPAFIKLLGYEMQTNRIASACVLFAILCGSRNSEARLARWDWLNADMSVMTFPAEVMKSGKEHLVPLSTQAIELLKSLPRSGELIFPSQHTYGEHKPMLDKALRELVKRIPGGEAVTLHGFRSSFRDWSSDNRVEENFILEFCLAHVTGPGAELAYRRSENLDRRRTALQRWADYATGSSAKVLPFKRVA